jgi:outer membrane protein assembly factor BamB
MPAADSGSGRSRLERIHLHGWDDNGGCRQTLSATSAVTRFNAARRARWSGWGKPLWTFTTRARVDSSPAIAGGRVFVGSNDGRVYGLDLASGKKVWEYEAASPVTSSPAVAKGKVVVATADGQVICFG